MGTGFGGDDDEDDEDVYEDDLGLGCPVLTRYFLQAFAFNSSFFVFQLAAIAQSVLLPFNATF